MKQRQKRSFQTQLTSSLLISLLISIFIIGICLILTFSEAEQKNQSYLERLNGQWAAELNFMMSSVEKMRFLQLINDDINEIIADGKDSKPQGDQIAQETYMQQILDILCTINSDVLRATIITASGDIYSNYVENSQASIALADEHLLYEKRDGKNEYMITDVYEGNINLIPYSMLTLRYPLYGIESAQSLGAIYIDLDFGSIGKRFSTGEQQEGWANFILNRNGVIYSSDADLANEIGSEQQQNITDLARRKTGSGKISIAHQNYIVCVEYLEALDWCLVQCVRQDLFFFREMRGMYLLAFWVLLLLLAQIYVGSRLVKWVSTPIRELSQVMGQAATKENKSLRYMQCREDDPAEVYEISQGYNTMLNRIEENIIREYEAQLVQKKTELQMLQYQINPHFLYNTLNTMSAIARLNDIPYISDISESLSKLFAYSVKGRQVVTLQEELANLQNYIRIQMIRFPEKFEVSYQIEPDLMECKVLKLLLQPILENAIDHGIAEKSGGGKGRIEIQAQQTGARWELSVCDNGSGMTGQELDQILDSLRPENRSGNIRESIGIRNVHMRVQNYYGAQYGLTVKSEQGKGTRVSITFPIKTDDMEGI